MAQARWCLTEVSHMRINFATRGPQLAHLLPTRMHRLSKVPNRKDAKAILVLQILPRLSYVKCLPVLLLTRCRLGFLSCLLDRDGCDLTRKKEFWDYVMSICTHPVMLESLSMNQSGDIIMGFTLWLTHVMCGLHGPILKFIMIFILGQNHHHHDAANWHGHGHCNNMTFWMIWKMVATTKN